jgi:small subunit ribosomal protein S8
MQDMFQDDGARGSSSRRHEIQLVGGKMYLTDPIADMLTRIRNAVTVKDETVDIPASTMKLVIANILKDEGYISKVETVTKRNKKIIRVSLKYGLKKKPVITGIKRVSTPGRRIYKGKTELPRIRSGFGIALISTSKGILTDSGAREQGVGGEIICYVW